MKTLVALIVLLCLGAEAYAQEAPPPVTKAPLPPGPLLNRTPNYSKWTVITEAPAPTGGQAATGAPGTQKVISSQVTVTKTGPTVLEESLYPDGRSQQVWHLGSMQATARADGSPPIIAANLPGRDIYNTDFSTSDFAGLSWISSQTYVGTAVQKGKKCLVFTGKINPLTPEEMARKEVLELREAVGKAGAAGIAKDYHFDPLKYYLSATVYIDFDTRLPLLMTFGSGGLQTRVYTYVAPPSDALNVPPLIAKSLAMVDQRAKDLSRAPHQ